LEVGSIRMVSPFLTQIYVRSENGFEKTTLTLLRV
jgi:hypothetical protein